MVTNIQQFEAALSKYAGVSIAILLEKYIDIDNRVMEKKNTNPIKSALALMKNLFESFLSIAKFEQGLISIKVEKWNILVKKPGSFLLIFLEHSRPILRNWPEAY